MTLAEILEFLEAVGGFIISTLQAILEFLVMIPQWIAMLGTAVAFIPGILLPFAMLGMFITILLLLMGRNS